MVKKVYQTMICVGENASDYFCDYNIPVTDDIFFDIEKCKAHIELMYYDLYHERHDFSINGLVWHEKEVSVNDVLIRVWACSFTCIHCIIAARDLIE